MSSEQSEIPEWISGLKWEKGHIKGSNFGGGFVEDTVLLYRGIEPDGEPIGGTYMGANLFESFFYAKDVLEKGPTDPDWVVECENACLEAGVQGMGSVAAAVYYLDPFMGHGSR